MPRTLCAVIGVAVAMALAIPPAEARPKHPGIHKAHQYARAGRSARHPRRATKAGARRAAVQVARSGECDPWVGGMCGAGVNVPVIRPSNIRRGAKSASVRHSGRPAGCPRAYCGCWLALRLFGHHVRSLWLARNWARIGRPASGPAPGVIAVYARGRRGGHVGIVTAVPGPGRIVLLSGNDGRRVRERERSTRGVIAYRNL